MAWKKLLEYVFQFFYFFQFCFSVHLQATSQTIQRNNNRMHLYIIIACFLALFLLLASVSSSAIFVFPQHWFLKAGVRNWRIWPLKSVFQRPLRPTMTRKRYLTYDLSASAGFHLLYWASQMTETLSDAQIMLTNKWSAENAAFWAETSHLRCAVLSTTVKTSALCDSCTRKALKPQFKNITPTSNISFQITSALHASQHQENRSFEHICTRYRFVNRRS